MRVCHKSMGFSICALVVRGMFRDEICRFILVMQKMQQTNWVMGILHQVGAHIENLLGRGVRVIQKDGGEQGLLECGGKRT